MNRVMSVVVLLIGVSMPVIAQVHDGRPAVPSTIRIAVPDSTSPIWRLSRPVDVRSGALASDNVKHTKHYLREGTLIGAAIGTIAGVTAGSYMQGGCPLQTPSPGQSETSCSESHAHLQFMAEGGITGLVSGAVIGGLVGGVLGWLHR